MAAIISNNLGSDCLDLRNTDFNPFHKQQQSSALAKILNERGPVENAKVKKVYARGTFLQPEDFIFLSQQCPNIEILNLERAHRIDDAAVKAIAQSFGKNLLELNLSCARNDADLHRKEGPIWTVSHYDIKNIVSITDAGVLELLQKTPKLSKLDLSNTKISYLLIPAILKSSLTFLGVKNCIRLGDGADERADVIDELWAQRPWMTISDDRGIHSHVKALAYWKWISLRLNHYFVKIQVIISEILAYIRLYFGNLYALLHSMQQ